MLTKTCAVCLFTPQRPTEAAISTLAEYKIDLRATLKLAAPLIAGFAGNQALGLVDTICSGWLGQMEVAAVGLGNSIFFAGSILGVGVMMGLDPLVAQAIGAGKPGTARGYLRDAGRVGLLLAVPSILFVLLLAFVGLPLAGVDAETQAGVIGYLWARAPSAVPMMLFIAHLSYLQAIGRTKPIFWATVIGNCINLPANMVLATGDSALVSVGLPAIGLGDGMGVAGIGLSSLLVTSAEAAFLWWIVGRLESGEGSEATRDGQRALWRMGWPVGLHYLLEMGVFSLVTVLMGGLGQVIVGGHQVALQLASLTFTVCLGLSSAGAARVGNAVGRGDPEGAYRAGVTVILIAMAFMSCSALVFAFAGRTLARWVADVPAIVEVAVPLLQIAAAFQLFDAMQAVAAGVLRGAGETKAALYINLVGHWVIGLPTGLVLTYVLDFGPAGLWWGLTAGLAFAGILLVARFLSRARLARAI